MKLENLLLRCLILACLAVCVLTMSAMLAGIPATAVDSTSLGTILLSAPSQCALPADGVLCPLPQG